MLHTVHITICSASVYLWREFAKVKLCYFHRWAPIPYRYMYFVFTRLPSGYNPKVLATVPYQRQKKWGQHCSLIDPPDDFSRWDLVLGFLTAWVLVSLRPENVQSSICLIIPGCFHLGFSPYLLAPNSCYCALAPITNQLIIIVIFLATFRWIQSSSSSL